MSLDDLTELDCEGLLAKLNSTSDIREKNEIIMTIGNSKCIGSYETLRTYVNTKLRHQTLIAMGKIDYDTTLGVVIGLFRTEEGNKNLDRNIDALSYIFANRIELVKIDRFIEELGRVLPKYFTSGNFLEDKTKRTISRALRDGIKISGENKYMDQARQAIYS